MPMVRGEAQAPRKAPTFDLAQTDAMGAYVQSIGGGPLVPATPTVRSPITLIGNNVARGGDLYRLNCASCHNFTGRGGALSSGKYAPRPRPGHAGADLHRHADRTAEHAEVLRSSALTGEKKDIIAYVRSSSQTMNPGGYGLGGFGPVPEGAAIFVVGMAVAIAIAMWIRARA